MAEDLRAEIHRHIEHLSTAEAACSRLWYEMSTATDEHERARLEAQRTIELDVFRSHWSWLYQRGIDFKHLDCVGMQWKPYETIDLVAIAEAELAAKAADRERMRRMMRMAALRDIMASASQ